jgi:hypothetical protein
MMRVENKMNKAAIFAEKFSVCSGLVSELFGTHSEIPEADPNKTRSRRIQRHNKSSQAARNIKLGNSI